MYDGWEIFRKKKQEHIYFISFMTKKDKMIVLYM